MTRQNAFHKSIVRNEQCKKYLLRNAQRMNKGARVTRTYQNRKWWRQFDRNFIKVEKEK